MKQGGDVLLDITNVDKYQRLSSILNLKKGKNGDNLIVPGNRNRAVDPTLLQLNDRFVCTSTLGVVGALENKTENVKIKETFNTGYTAVSVKKIQIRLGDLLHDQIFNVNKDNYYTDMELTLTFNKVNSIFRKQTGGANIGLMTYVIADGATHITAVPSANNIQMLVSIQNNKLLSDQIESYQNQNKQNRIIIPQINYDQKNIGPSLIQTNSTKIDNYGGANQRLYKIYYGLFNADSQNLVDINGVLQLNNCSINAFSPIGGGLMGYINNAKLILNNDLLFDFPTPIFYNHVKSQFKNNNLYSMEQFFEQGTFSTVFNSEAQDENEYDNNTLKGKKFPNSGSLALTYKFDQTDTTPREHVLFSVVLYTYENVNGKLKIVNY